VNTRNVPAKRDILAVRSRLLRLIRRFFYERNAIEVETPVRVRAPALEEYIDAEPSGDAYLRTSPELHMKRLMAAGHGHIFQIGPCFRKGESGRLHHPEFTMLEWYRAGADYRDILDETRSLVRSVARGLLGGCAFEYGGTPVDLDADWQVITVADAFAEYAKADVASALRSDRFHALLVEKIEPRLGIGRPSVLIDYPIELAALARSKPAHPTVAERWELYIAGVELANAFSELTDAGEQRRRFADCAAFRRKTGNAAYPLDESFMQALSDGMPNTAGCALGVDRLMMVLTGADDIGDVVAFRE